MRIGMVSSGISFRKGRTIAEKKTPPTIFYAFLDFVNASPKTSPKGLQLIDVGKGDGK